MSEQHPPESETRFILDIQWDWDSTETAVSLPALVGPFDTRDEANHWARLNISNGTFHVRPLAYPYLRTRVIPPEETR